MTESYHTYSLKRGHNFHKSIKSETERNVIRNHPINKSKLFRKEAKEKGMSQANSMNGHDPLNPPPYNPEYSNNVAQENYDQAQGQNEVANSEEKKTGKGVVIGAAAVGGVAGLVLVGPLVGLAAGAGAAVAATTSGKAGDVARSSGNLACAVGGRAKKIDKDYRVSEQTKSFAVSTGKKAKEFDEKHQVVAKSKSAASSVAKSASEFNEKHRVTEKAAKGFTSAANFITSKIKAKE